MIIFDVVVYNTQFASLSAKPHCTYIEEEVNGEESVDLFSFQAKRIMLFFIIFMLYIIRFGSLILRLHLEFRLQQESLVDPPACYIL